MKSYWIYILLLQEVHELNLAELAKVSLQLLLAESVKVFDVADVNVACCARVNGQSECRGQRTRVLAPANLEPSIVESQSLEGCHLIKGKRSSRIDEGDKLQQGCVNKRSRVKIYSTHSDMFVLHVSQALKNTATNSITKVLGRSLGVNITKVHSPIQALRAQVIERISRREWKVWCHRRCRKTHRAQVVCVDRR
jgi:hypothetical protein